MSAGPVAWPQLAHIHTIAFDFDGVFTNNKVYVTQEGLELVRCDRGDGLGINFLQSCIRRGVLNAEVFILSKEPNPVVLARAKKLKLECRHGVSDKLAFMDEYLASRNLGQQDPYRGLVFLGNDLNDLPLMSRGGWSVAPEDAHPKVKEMASAVLPWRGGEGFVRAFVERLLGIDHMTTEEIYELVRYC